MDLELLRSCGIIKKYPTDTIITIEGEKGEEMYFILSGKVGVYLNTFADDAIHVTELGAGEVFGEISMLDDLPRSSTVVALEPVSALVVGKEHFELFLSTQPDMAVKIMKSLCSRIRNYIQIINSSAVTAKKTMITSAVASTTNSSTTVANQSTPSAGEDIIIKSLFPPEHKKYDLVPSFDSTDFIFDKQVACPICSNKFTTIGQKASKLRSKGMDNDLRKRYENFDPLWYNVWTCPECFYSNFYHEFPNISPNKYKLVSAKVKSILNGAKPVILKDASINQLFTQYYLLLECSLAMGVPNVKLGKIWMNMMWLYRDCGDEEMVKIASETALKYYHETYIKSEINLKPEDDQQLCIILAELNIINDNLDEAFKYLMQARKQSGGSKTFSQMAEYRIDELKKSKQE